MGGIGAPFNGLKAFATTEQMGIYDKLANALALGTSPIVKALFDFDAAMVRIYTGCYVAATAERRDEGLRLSFYLFLFGQNDIYFLYF